MAAMRFSGMPQGPNPPAVNVAPSARSAIASSALATVLSMAASIIPALGLRVGGARLRRAEARRGRVWEPSQGSHENFGVVLGVWDTEIRADSDVHDRFRPARRLRC